MTPERLAYLKKCSRRELWIRNQLAEAKGMLKHDKHILNSANVDEAYDCFSFEIDYLFHSIKYIKYKISVLRHELNRLKHKKRNTFVDGFVCGYNEALRKVSEARRINYSQVGRRWSND